MAKITCALRKEQIGLLIQYTASYMRGVDKYNMIDILTPLQKVVGDDIIQYASILPDTISSIMVLDRKTFKKSNSVDQFQELAESFEDYDAVEKYLIDNNIIKKETLSGAKTPVSTDTKTDIEAKKADIERRRQEELKNTNITVEDRGDDYYSLVETKGTVISFEERDSLIGKKINFIVKNPNNNKLINNYKGTIIKHESAGITGDLRIDLELDNGQTFSIDRNGNFYTQSNVRFTEEIPNIVTEINAKYDAELAALEKQPEKKSTTRTLKKLNELLDKFENLKLADTTEGLEKQLEEVKDDVDNFVNNEEQFGEFNGMLSSLVQSGEAKLKVEAKIKGKIESIKQTEELENKKQEKKKKEVSNLSKVFDPLSSSSSQQRVGKPSIKGDKVISTQITVWTMLREIIRKGFSPTDAGYYATVMNNTLEDEYLFEDTKESLNDGIINKEKIIMSNL